MSSGVQGAAATDTPGVPGVPGGGSAGARGSLVSVVIPMYNAERFVAAALESVFAQAYEPLEVVVVDDGSIDGGAEIADAWPVRLLRLPHAGIAVARNAGVAAARGELIAFLDADDTWLPGSLELRVRHLLARPAVDFVLGRAEIFLEPGAALPAWLPDWLSGTHQGLLPTFLGRREAFDAVGPFDPSYPVGEDIEWLARAKDVGCRGETMPLACLRYRLHGANTTHHDRAQVDRMLLRTLRGTVARQRREAQGRS